MASTMGNGRVRTLAAASTGARGADRPGVGPLVRLLGAALLLVVAGAAAFVLLVSLGLVDAGAWAIAGRPFDQILPLGGGAPALTRLTAGAVALVAGLLSAYVVLRGVAPARAPSEPHVLVADGNGMVVVETRGIASVALAAVSRLPGVAEARVEVSGRGVEPVGLLVTLWLSAAAELREVADRARHRARDAVQHLVGIDVHEVVVRVEVVPLEHLGRMLR